MPRTRTLLRSLSFWLAASTACNRGRHGPAAAAAVRAEARAAYRLVMDSVVRSEDARMAVLDRPAVPLLSGVEVRALPDLRGLDQALRGLQAETLRDFVARQSASTAAWREDVRAARDVELVSDSLARARLDSVRWAPPVVTHTIVQLSAAGFNPARTQGLVYAAYSCGPLCGAGVFVLVVRQPGGVWKVSGTFQSFAS